MGLDATRPVVYHEHVFTKVRVPGEEDIDLHAAIDSTRRIDFLAAATPGGAP